MDNDVACALAHAMRGSLHVKTIDVAYNPFGIGGASALIDALRTYDLSFANAGSFDVDLILYSGAVIYNT